MKKILQCDSIGKLGMFGNSIFQYCAIKAYAEEFGFEYRISSDWIGHKIFDIKDKLITGYDETIYENDIIFGTNYTGSINFHGFFQQPIFYSLISLGKCREWLQIKDKWKKRFPKKDNFYIACHLRRGDFVTLHHSYPVIQEIAYLNSVHKYKFNPNNVIWVSENTPLLDDECNNLGIGFLPDFMTLVNSDVLFRGPSTFGFWAGIIGYCKMYSPDCDFPDYDNGRVGFISDVKFVEGLGPNKEGIFRL